MNMKCDTIMTNYTKMVHQKMNSIVLELELSPNLYVHSIQGTEFFFKVLPICLVWTDFFFGFFSIFG